MMSVQLTANLKVFEEDRIKHSRVDAVINKAPMSQPDSMVTSVYHTKKLKSQSGPVNNAQLLKGGGGEGRRGETTGRGT